MLGIVAFILYAVLLCSAIQAHAWIVLGVIVYFPVAIALSLMSR
jgi:hypothetical protein